jgi:hypothetical protein
VELAAKTEVARAERKATEERMMSMDYGLMVVWIMESGRGEREREERGLK